MRRSYGGGAWPTASVTGMMSGPNLERTNALTEAVNAPIIASGGINEIEDIKKLAQLDLEGAIIGRALYEETLNLADAIKAAKSI